MKVWVLQTGEPLHCDMGSPRPMRAMNLANALVAAGHEVVLWSSAFYHQEKRHRSRNFERITISPRLEIRLIPSPGYSRNIGPARLWDHALLAWNLRRQLKRETSPPDVAFIGYPPIEVAVFMTRWLAERRTPTVLDIKDQWPHLFVDALPRVLKPLGRVVLAPYFYFAKRALSQSTGLSAMAERFLAWALDFAGRKRNDHDIVVPLTTPSGQISGVELEAARRWWDGKGIVSDDRLRLCFVGSHSVAFDIEPIYVAAKHFSLRDNQIEFVICGSGERSAEWRSLMANLSNVHFPGWVDRAQIEVLAERSHAALAPYENVENFTNNLPNKVIDALALGLPILSPLQGEVSDLITRHNVGLRYGTDSGRTLVQCIDLIKDDPVFRQKLGKNAIDLYQERFSFEKVYGGLVQHLEVLGEKGRAH